MLGSGGVGSFCLDCAEWPEALASVRSCFLHEEPASRLVWRFKYEGWNTLGGFMARYLAACAGRLGVGFDLVTWVPTTPWRRRIRGYDQAEILAREVADRLKMRAVSALSRRRGGSTQVALQPAGRLANVRRAFAVREEASSRLAGAHVLLVDDVLTTGATAVAAATALSQARVRCVRVVTFARATPLRRPDGDARKER